MLAIQDVEPFLDFCSVIIPDLAFYKPDANNSWEKHLRSLGFFLTSCA